MAQPHTLPDYKGSGLLDMDFSVACGNGCTELEAYGRWLTDGLLLRTEDVTESHLKAVQRFRDAVATIARTLPNYRRMQLDSIGFEQRCYKAGEIEADVAIHYHHFGVDPENCLFLPAIGGPTHINAAMTVAIIEPEGEVPDVLMGDELDAWIEEAFTMGNL